MQSSTEIINKSFSYILDSKLTKFLEKKGAAKIITSYEELKTMLNSYLDDELSKLEFNIKAGNDHIGKVLINEIN